MASATDYGVRLALLESVLRLSCRPEVMQLRWRFSRHCLFTRAGLCEVSKESWAGQSVNKPVC